MNHQYREEDVYVCSLLFFVYIHLTNEPFDWCQFLQIMKDKTPVWQSLKSRAKMFSLGLITEILFFHELFSTFKTQLEHLSRIEMSTDKK